MVDLKGHYLNIKEEIEQAALSVMREANHIKGPDQRDECKSLNNF